VALKNDGSVIAWGSDNLDQTNVPATAQSGVIAIAAGEDHTLALKSDGSRITWGFSSYAPELIPPPGAQTGVVAIAAGGDHSLALKSDGSVIAWGVDRSGDTSVPIAAQSGVIAIAAGDRHNIALKANGTIVVWGDNSTGQCDVPAAAQTDVVAIAAAGGDDEGRGHTVVLKSDGTILVWGYNGYGQTNVPSGLVGVTTIAAGGYNTVALIGIAMPLTALRNDSELILSWPKNVVGFKLQTASELASTIPWLDVTSPPVLMGIRWTITNTFSTNAQFYRLRKF
jgi:alpha-tubulin suppressor-like RCC1 family protein